jgi:hypothetical protein
LEPLNIVPMPRHTPTQTMAKPPRPRALVPRTLLALLLTLAAAAPAPAAGAGKAVFTHDGPTLLLTTPDFTLAVPYAHDKGTQPAGVLIVGADTYEFKAPKIKVGLLAAGCEPGGALARLLSRFASAHGCLSDSGRVPPLILFLSSPPLPASPLPQETTAKSKKTTNSAAFTNIKLKHASRGSGREGIATPAEKVRSRLGGRPLEVVSTLRR